MTTLRNYFYVLLLTAIVILISVVNYVPGTWLTGWDNLHTELNFPLHIYRSFFGVWQEYQGLGLLAGMAHAADLPRQIFLYALSFIVPTSFLRYLFQFLMLLAGTLGTYKLVKDIIFKKESNAPLGGFLAGLFYLLNLGTIQYFYVPFEPYSTFWGLFPWSMYTLLKYLDVPTRKNFMFLLLVFIISIPQSVVQTVFLVYLIAIFIILASFVLLKKTWRSVRISLVLLITVFIVNSFWLLPNLYFTLTNVGVTQNAMNNKMNNDRFYEINKRRGTIVDFALMREFYYDFTDYGESQRDLGFMMQTWRKHIENPLITLLGISFFGLVLIGFTRRNHYRRYFIPLFILSGLALLSDTIGFSQINSLLRSVPLVNQIFRNPFTKFIVPTILTFTVFFAIGATWLIQKLHERFTPSVRKFFAIGIVFLLFIYSSPVFTGNLFYSRLRVNIPKEYFELFGFFNSQDHNARIMNLPQDSFWGWGYYTWGSRGSGFLWYGIPQPITDRAFDVWSRESEMYYWELSYALKKNDLSLFNNVIDKYQISFVLFDSSYSPSDSTSPKGLLKQNDLLSQNPRVELAGKFGDIAVYKVLRKDELSSPITLTGSLPSVTYPDYFMNEDVAFGTVGMYSYQASTESPEYIFPFQTLFTGRFAGEGPIRVEETEQSYELSSSVSKGSYTIHLPSLSSETMIPYEVYALQEKNIVKISFRSITPTVRIDQAIIEFPKQTIEVAVDNPSDLAILDINGKDFFEVPPLTDNYTRIGTTYLRAIDDFNYLNVYSARGKTIQTLKPESFAGVTPCQETPEGHIDSKVMGNTLEVEAQNKAACLVYTGGIDEEQRSSAYKVSFAYKSESDEFPDYCFYNDFEKKCLNTRSQTLRTFSSRFKPVTDYFEMNVSLPSKNNFSLVLDPQNSAYDSRIKKITYKDIVLENYPFVSRVPLNSVGTTDYKLPRTLDSKDIYVSLLKTDSSFGAKNMVQNNMYKESNVAHNILFGDTYKVDTNEGKIKLSATDTFVNYWLEVPHISNGDSFLVSIDGVKKSGFPPLLNISSVKDKRKLVTTLLNDDAGQGKRYYILPSYNEFDEGLQILFNNNSFNKTPTEYEINFVDVSPVPYRFITKLYLSRNDISPLETSTYSVDIKKNNLSSYIVNFKPSPDQSLILWQAYNRGWKAYKVNETNIFSKLFPFIFGKQLTSHIKINNWANGWEIDESVCQELSTCRIIIVFWPQYLEYLGFILTGLTTVLVLGHWFHKRRRTESLKTV